MRLKAPIFPHFLVYHTRDLRDLAIFVKCILLYVWSLSLRPTSHHLGSKNPPRIGASAEHDKLTSYYVASPVKANKLQKIGDVVSTIKSPSVYML